MGKSLYLIETRAQRPWVCEGCGVAIHKGSKHFRHDPHPYARMLRGEPTTHWCYTCVSAANAEKDAITGRIKVPVVKVLEGGRSIALAKIEVVPVGELLARHLISNPDLIYELTPDQFEELVCERLYAMGLEPQRVGNVYRKDGGIDIFFWPRIHGMFPFLGAAQVKHHRRKSVKEGVGAVRDFAGTVGSLPINAGLLITNTTFSADATWFARERAKLLRLRDISDVQRWLRGNFDDNAEWREMPSEVEVCPGIVVPVGGGKRSWGAE